MTTDDKQGRTNQLDALLMDIQNMQQTGRVEVERSKGGVHEKGTITFLYGQAVDAQTSGRSGDEALQWLLTWGNSRYAFHPQSPADVVASLPSPPTDVPAAPSTSTSPLASITQFLSKRMSFPGDSTRATNGNGYQAEKPGESAYMTHVPGTPPPFPERTTTPLPPSNAIVPQSYMPNSAPQVVAPYRLLHGPEALNSLERNRVSRLHRHVFFLLDGQRTLQDLARITGHTVGEIQRLLADLEYLHLIKQ